jgi:hypothetical protein
MLFVAYVSISSILGRLTEWYLRGSQSPSQRNRIEEDLHRWIDDLPEELRTTDSSGRPRPYDFDTRQLSLPYFTAISILYRPHHLSGECNAASVLASSCVVRIVEDFLARDELRYINAMLAIYLLVAGLGQLSCHRVPDLWSSSATELDIVVQALEELAHTWHTAKGSLRILRKAQSIVASRPSNSTAIPIKTHPDYLSYFSPFGEGFCSKWSLLIPAMKAAVPTLTETDPQQHLPVDMLTPPTTSHNQNLSALGIPGVPQQDTLFTAAGEDFVPSQDELGELGMNAKIMTTYSDDNSIHGYGDWLLQNWGEGLQYGANTFEDLIPHNGF